MRSLFLSTLFLLLTAIAYAQPDDNKSAIDSLLRSLPTVKNDEQKVRIYQQLSYLCSMSDPDKGIEYANKQLELATKMKWNDQIAIAYGNLGQNYESKGDYPHAIDNVLKTLAIFQGTKDSSNIATTMIVVGEIYCNIHDYQKALYYDSTALGIFSKLNKRAEAIACYNSLGGVFNLLKKYNESIGCYFKAYDMADSMQDDDAMAAPLGNIGSTYSEMGEYSNALKYLFKALRLNQKTGNTLYEGINISTIGEVYFRIITDSVHKTQPDSLISPAKEVNLQKAEEYVTRSLLMQKEFGQLAGLTTSYIYLSEIQELKGNYKGALESYKLFKKYSDSTESTDVKLKVADAENKYQVELNAKQVEVNKLSVAQKRNERIIFAAGLGILLLISLGIYARLRNQRKTTRIQQVALQQKEMLMKEIHHRVKNNLQVISSLLNMQVANLSDPQVKEAMTESTSRLKAILLLHQQLYRNDQAANIECSGFITDLIGQVSTVFKKTGQNIKLDNRIDPTILDIDTGMSLGLIVNELTTNSYKYAFEEGTGTITVEIKRAGIDDYKLYYRDSGPGLPDDLDTKMQQTLGMKIINSLSRQIGGAMNYDKTTKTFIITFKDVEGRKKKA